MGDAMEEEFARRFERTDPHWRYPQNGPLDNYNSQCDASADSIVIAPLPQIIRESGVTGYEPKATIDFGPRSPPRKYRPRKMCCVTNITVCIVLVTILALLLIAAVIAIIVIVVKHGKLTTTPEIVTHSNVMTSTGAETMTETATTTTTTTTKTTTTTPPRLYGYLSTRIYNVSIMGNPKYIASFDIDPRKPDSFIAVDNSLHVVFLFDINSLNATRKALFLENAAYMESCKTFTMKSSCLAETCSEDDITYCAEGCPESMDFCKMGNLKVNGPSPYICAAYASFIDKDGIVMDVSTKNNGPSCSIELVRLHNYTDTIQGNRSSCTVDENNFSSAPQFGTLTAIGDMDQIDWMAAVDGNGSIIAVRLKDSATFTTVNGALSNQTKLYITYVDQSDAQVIAVDGTQVTYYRLGDRIYPVFYGNENLVLHENSRLTVSSDGTIYVLSPWPDSTSLYRLAIHTVIWK